MPIDACGQYFLNIHVGRKTKSEQDPCEYKKWHLFSTQKPFSRCNEFQKIICDRRGYLLQYANVNQNVDCFHIKRIENIKFFSQFNYNLQDNFHEKNKK